MVNKELDSHEGLGRRKFGRFTCTVDIFIKIPYRGDDGCPSVRESGYLITPASKGQKAKLVNLSLSGAKLLAKSPIGVSTSVTISIRGFPNTPLIEAKAMVIWCKGARLESGVKMLKDQNYVGVTFYGLGWRQRFQLKKLVKRLSREL